MISSCVPQPLAEDHALASGARTFVQQRDQFVGLVPSSVSWSSRKVLLHDMRMFCSAQCRRSWSLSERKPVLRQRCHDARDDEPFSSWWTAAAASSA
jgi:hypothetical protein